MFPMQAMMRQAPSGRAYTAKGAMTWAQGTPQFAAQQQKSALQAKTLTATGYGQFGPRPTQQQAQQGMFSQAPAPAGYGAMNYGQPGPQAVMASSFLGGQGQPRRRPIAPQAQQQAGALPPWMQQMQSSPQNHLTDPNGTAY